MVCVRQLFPNPGQWVEDLGSVARLQSLKTAPNHVDFAVESRDATFHPDVVVGGDLLPAPLHRIEHLHRLDDPLSVPAAYNVETIVESNSSVGHSSVQHRHPWAPNACLQVHHLNSRLDHTTFVCASENVDFAAKLDGLVPLSLPKHA